VHPCLPEGVALFWHPQLKAVPQFGHLLIVVGFYII